MGLLVTRVIRDGLLVTRVISDGLLVTRVIDGDYWLRGLLVTGVTGYEGYW